MAFKYPELTEEEKQAQEIRHLVKETKEQLKDKLRQINNQAKDLFDMWAKEDRCDDPTILAEKSFKFANAFFDARQNHKIEVMQGFDDMDD
jgi:hypothetical protein